MTNPLYYYHQCMHTIVSTIYNWQHQKDQLDRTQWLPGTNLSRELALRNLCCMYELPMNTSSLLVPVPARTTSVRYWTKSLDVYFNVKKPTETGICVSSALSGNHSTVDSSVTMCPAESPSAPTSTLKMVRLLWSTH